MRTISGLIFLCLISSANLHAAACWDATVVNVIDGSTLQVKRGRTLVTIRLYGLEAPAPNHPAAGLARDFLIDYTSSTQATVCRKNTASGGAYEVHVLRGFMQNVNRKLVRKGLAKSAVHKYAADQTHARKNSLGIWSPVNDEHKKGHNHSGRTSRVDRQTNTGSAAGAPPAGGLTVYSNETGGHREPEKPLDQLMRESEAGFQRRDELEALRGRELIRDDYEPGLSDVDYVEIDTYFDYGSRDSNGTIEISLYYASTNLGRDVYWEDGELNCECRVQGHFSNGTNTRIARSSTLLRSYRDRVFITLPAYYLDENDFTVLNYCTVECRVSAGIFDLKAADRFEVFFQGNPLLYDPYQ